MRIGKLPQDRVFTDGQQTEIDVDRAGFPSMVGLSSAMASVLTLRHQEPVFH